MADGKCTRCSPDCATCSGAGGSKCLTCPRDRPLLRDGRCLPSCPQGMYAAGSKCEPCNDGCSTCTSGASCTSCASGHVLRAGACVTVPCLFANSFGICLSGFLDTSADCTSNTPPSPSSATQFKARSSSTTLAPLAALAVLPLLALLAWYIRRQRRETRKRTAEFADQLDKHEVNKRLDVLAADEELERKKRRGLKDLWLKNKARVALPRSHEEGQTGQEQRSPPLAQARPEAVHMQDFSKRSSYSNEIGQDPASLEPSQGSNFPPPVSARWPGMNGTSMGAPSTAPSTIPPEAPKTSLDLTHLWPNLASRPNAL